MAEFQDALSALPQITFDGLPTVPCQSMSITFGHTLAARSYPYVDGDGHEHTGRKSHVMEVRLLFVNTLGLEQPGVILFPDIFNQWLARLFDGKAGNLEHPILGNLRARVMGGTVPIVAEVRSGSIVDVTFVETLDDPTQAIPFTGAQSVTAAAALAEQSAAAVGISYPTGEPLEVSLSDAFASVAGQLGSLATSVSGKINQVRGDVEDMIEAAESLQDHAAYAAVDNLTAAWDVLVTIAESGPIKTSRAKAMGTTQSETTIDAIADAVSNSTQEIIDLNPTLLRRPMVPKGASFTYYTGDTTGSISL
jgi:prophage DNA circulation protein